MSTHAPITTLSDREITIVRTLWSECQSAGLRMLAFGSVCLGLKEKLAHGSFQDALEKQLPDLAYRSVARYMQVTQRVLELKNLTPGQFFQMCNALHFSHPGEFFSLPEGDLPKEACPLRAEIAEFVSGKSGRALALELRSNNEPGGFHPSHAAVQAWLKEHAPDHVGTKFDALPAEVQAACKKYLLKHPVKISATERAKLRNDRGLRWLKEGAQTMDEGDWKDYDAEHLDQLKHFLRDYYKTLAAIRRTGRKNHKSK